MDTRIRNCSVRIRRLVLPNPETVDAARAQDAELIPEAVVEETVAAAPKARQWAWIKLIATIILIVFLAIYFDTVFGSRK